MRLAHWLAALLLSACAFAPWPHEDDLARVRNGMTQDEVRRLVGPPQSVENFARQRQVAWDYSLFDNFGYFAIASIIFDDQGRVVSRVHRRIDKGND